MVDLNHILKLRLVVARFGEMDGAGWWNTKGVLGRMGRTVYERGFPATHDYARARVAFAVARHRCQAVYDASGSITLWKMPAELEDQFEVRWLDWQEEGTLQELMGQMPDASSDDLLGALGSWGLLTDVQRQTAEGLRRTAGGRAVQVRLGGDLDEEAFSLLAAGFARSEQGQLTVPFAQL